MNTLFNSHVSPYLKPPMRPAQAQAGFVWIVTATEGGLMSRVRYVARWFIVAVAWLMASPSAVAAEAWHTSTIKVVYPLADGGYVLIFSSSAAACVQAATDKYHYVKPNQNGMTEEGAAKIYAAALTAQAMGRTVKINFDDASSNCYVNRLMLYE